MRSGNLYRKFLSLVFTLAITGVLAFQMQAASLSPTLAEQADEHCRQC